MKPIHALLDGYRAFYREHFAGESTLYRQLAEQGQSPEVLVIACSDSRVDPGIVFDAGPGDLFTVRNVANLVPPHEPDSDSRHGTSAALEFGVCHLGVRHIVVLGHSECAGIRALMEGAPTAEDVEFSFISDWMTIGNEAKARALTHGGGKEESHQHCEHEAILLSLQNLQTFPWIQSRINAEALHLHGWYFDIHSGALEMYSEENEAFEAVMV